MSLEGLVNWHLGCKTQCIYKLQELHTGESAHTGTRWAVPAVTCYNGCANPRERHGYTAVIYSRRRGHLLWQTGIALSNTHQKPTAASKSTRIKSIALISNYNPVLCCCSPYIISTLQDIGIGKSSSLPLRLINAGRELKPPRTHCYHSYYQSALLNLRLPDF